MNTRQPIDESAGPVALSVAFSEESNYFAVGLDTGFCSKNNLRLYFSPIDAVV